MKKYITFFLIVMSVGLKAQTEIRGKLINFKTNEAIEFANIWLVEENTGTTSNINGEFVINTKSLNLEKHIKISSIGFYDTTIVISKINNTNFVIKLYEKEYSLSEVVVKPDRKPKNVSLNKIRQKDIFVRIVSSNVPRMIANYFPFDSSLDNTMLKKIVIHTFLNQQDYLCNIRLYKAKNNMPTQELLNKNITCLAKKGSKNIKIDLSDYKLEFPKEGIYICFEWLIIDQNIRHVTIIDQKTNEKKDDVFYGPVLAGVAEDKPNQMIYYNGEWEKYDDYIGPDHWASNKHLGKYCNLGMSLEIFK